jgi:hypothetical protein
LRAFAQEFAADFVLRARSTFEENDLAAVAGKLESESRARETASDRD